MRIREHIYLTAIGLAIVTLFGCVSSPQFDEATLSSDKKDILDSKNAAMLSIDDDEIFAFFKTENGNLCAPSNITAKTRKDFCGKKETFRAKTRFSGIAPSSDKTKIGFTIESDELAPDTAVGIFYPFATGQKIRFLTNYYLGNAFNGFSPDSEKFAYTSGCFEGKCGIYIKEAETLNDIKILPGVPPDLNNVNYQFLRWATEDSIEYYEDDILKTLSLGNR